MMLIFKKLNNFLFTNVNFWNLYKHQNRLLTSKNKLSAFPYSYDELSY